MFTRSASCPMGQTKSSRKIQKSLVHLLFLLALLALPLLGNAQLANSPWPKFLGNSLNTAQGVGQGASSTVKWTFSAQQSIYSSPAIGADGTIYVGSDDFNVYALNGSTGAQVWSFATQSYVESSPAVGSDGTVYVGSDDNNLYALNGTTGVLKWSFATGSFIDGSPTVGAGGVVYVGSTDGNVYALNGSTGAVIWTFTTQGAVESTPAIGTDGTVYVGSDDGNLYALDGSAGTLKWSYNFNVPIFNSPTIGPDGTIFVGADQVYAVIGNGTSTPTLKWSQSYGFDVTCPIAIGANETIIVATADGTVRGVNGSNSNADVQWIYTSPAGAYESSPAIGADGTVYLASDAGVISAVSGTNGAQAWTYTATADQYGGSPAIGADGTLYIGALSGSLTAFTSLNPQSLILSPSSVPGGLTSTGTVVLNLPAPALGFVVPLSSDNADATVPSTVTILPGATSASFTVSTTSVSKSVVANISAVVDGSKVSAQLTIVPPSLTGLSFMPSAISGGVVGSGTVTLNGPAPTGGIQVDLSSSDTKYVKVPSWVIVSVGQSTGTFSATTTVVTAPQSSTITATYGGVTETAILSLNPASVQSLSLDPPSVPGGKISTGTVTLTGPAPSAGVIVKLTSSVKGVTVPLEVSVLRGKTSAKFTIRTVAVSELESATIEAAIGTSTQSATLTVLPATLSTVTVAPRTVLGGAKSVGTATLTGLAGTGGMVVNLASDSSDATVPASVKVLAGRSSATFEITTIRVAAPTTANITGTLGTVTATGSLAIKAPTITSVVLSPPTVKGTVSSTGTVHISSPAPASGLTISLSSSLGAATPPSIITIPAGKTSATFKVTTVGVAGRATATISASLNGTTKTAKLTIVG